MTLSSEERRVLDQLEIALAAEDPWLDRRLASGRRRLVHATVGWPVPGFILGLALLVLGMSIAVAVSVLGYLLMLGAVLSGAHAWRRCHCEPATDETS